MIIIALISFLSKSNDAHFYSPSSVCNNNLLALNNIIPRFILLFVFANSTYRESVGSAKVDELTTSCDATSCRDWARGSHAAGCWYVYVFSFAFSSEHQPVRKFPVACLLEIINLITASATCVSSFLPFSFCLHPSLTSTTRNPPHMDTPPRRRVRHRVNSFAR